MKFLKETNSKGLQIPTAATKFCGFDGKVELHTAEGALVVLKQRMTAMELIRAAHALHDLSMELHSHLAKICGTCDGCDGSCPFEDWEKNDIDLPDYLREKAGIPEEAKLYAWVDDEEQTVTIGIADYDHDLRDVPPEVLEMFAAAHVCIGELEERIVVGDIVYGEN